MNIKQNNITATIDNYVTSSFASFPNQFQSMDGTGASKTITIKFDKEIDIFSIDILDATYPGNSIVAYDNIGKQLINISPPVSPIYKITLQRGVNFSNSSKISTIQLIPAPGDFVMYKDMKFNGDSTATSIPVWRNGITNSVVEGIPPIGWNLSSDGSWYPPSVISNQNTNQNTPANLPTSNQITPIAAVGYIPYNIIINVIGSNSPKQLYYPITINVFGKPISYTPAKISLPQTLKINPITINIKQSFLNVFDDVIGDKINKYFDNDRINKTLLNFGNDYQALITNWKKSINDPYSFFIKLYSPLPNDVQVKKPTWISRELSTTLIDLATVIFTPDEGIKVYLRPANKSVSIRGNYGISSGKKTLQDLFSSGAFDEFNPSDSILEEWYINSLENSELNIDYSNYNKFVFFGSAVAKLEAFKNKIIKMEDLNRIIQLNYSSLSGTGSAVISGSQAYNSVKNIVEERYNIIRSFDGYERFLYYTTGSSYSSSFTQDFGDQVYYHSDAAWPKLGGTIVSYASASGISEPNSNIIPSPDEEQSWYQNQLDIAREYDRWNPNALQNNIPSYLVDDIKSSEFILFINMIGNHFDIIKSYIDSMSDIYNRDNAANRGLSKDLVWNIGKSLGIDLPNQYAIKSLIDYTIGTGSADNSKIYRDFATETWKRVIHNHIFLLKTKGTKTALNALLNIYGILPTTIQIRESTIVSPIFSSQSYETIDENTNVLDYSSSIGAYINIPWSASGHANTGIYTRFSQTQFTQSVIYNIDDRFALRITPYSSSYGRVEFLSESIVTVSSSYLPIFNGEFFSTFVQHNGTRVNLLVKYADGYDIQYDSNTSEITPTSLSVWNSPQRLYLGSSASLSLGRPFSGYIDEFRLWGEQITENTFNNWVRYPGLYHGESSTSARDYLFARLSFGIPTNYGSSSLNHRYAINESPFVKTLPIDNNLIKFTASGFTNNTTYPYNHQIVRRTVVRYSSTGGSQMDSNKIIIANPPVNRYVSGSNVPVLYKHKSIVSLNQKNTFNKPNNTIGFYFSPTDAINDNIIRSMGNFDVQELIGNPLDDNSKTYSALHAYNKLFWETYAYDYNINKFISFVRDILQPIFYQAKQLVPVRSKLLTGMVIEPTILERYKVQIKPVKISGGNLTKDTSDTQNLITNINTTGSIHTSATFPVYQITFDNQLQANVESEYLVRNAEIDTDTIYTVHTNYQPIQSSIELINDNNVEASTTPLNSNVNLDRIISVVGIYPTYEQEIDISEYTEIAKLSIISAIHTGSIPSQSFIIPLIKPRSDFDDLGATTYFMYSSGLVGLRVTIETRVNSLLIDRGTWSRGTTYVKGDRVIQPVTDVIDAVPGELKEFYCISGNPIISNMPPYLDRDNWRQVAYILSEKLLPRKAVLINNVISLVPTTSGLTPVTGYRPNHYKFTRDRSTATLRRLYLGCKQTGTTTFDNKSPIEIIQSPTDRIIVNDNPISVLPANNTGNPLLDVV